MASVDGLVTGMSTTDTVAQLMQVEALPQTALKNKVTAAEQGSDRATRAMNSQDVGR